MTPTSHSVERRDNVNYTLYDALHRWRLIHPFKTDGHAGVVLHTSCVNFSADDLNRLTELEYDWILTDETRAELRILQSSQRFGSRARYLLELEEYSQKLRRHVNAATSAEYILAGDPIRCKSWQLEQLYDPSVTQPDFERVSSRFERSADIYGGTLIFAFGDLNKLDEFKSFVADSIRCYTLSCSGWSCTSGGASIQKASRTAVRNPHPLPTRQPKRPDPCSLRKIDIRNCEGKRLRRINGTKLVLKRGMSGGEADIYTHPKLPGYYIKCYQRAAVTGYRLKKLQYLCRIAPMVAGMNAALPQELLHLDDTHALGFTMKVVPGVSLKHIMDTDRCFEQHDLSAILRNLALLLLELHTLHILVADLSANNIMVDDDCSVYLVDCDSFQVFSTPGGGVTPLYRHPSLDIAHLHDTLRFPLHVSFSFAVLLFQIYCWDNPLQQVRSADDDRELSWDNFGFPLDENGGGRDRVDADSYELWMSLSYEQRKAFSDEFRLREAHSLGHWIELFEI